MKCYLVLPLHLDKDVPLTIHLAYQTIIQLRIRRLLYQRSQYFLITRLGLIFFMTSSHWPRRTQQICVNNSHFEYRNHKLVYPFLIQGRQGVKIKTYPSATRNYKESSSDKFIIGDDSGRLMWLEGESRLGESRSSRRYKSLELDDSILRLLLFFPAETYEYYKTENI